MNQTLIQRARNIAAFVYEDQELARLESGKVPNGHTAEKWKEHVASYTNFMREGAYDDELAVRAALTALRQIEPAEIAA